ncbi:hypothetical protein [Roseovarius sp. EL26]|nr:hypothetical protein [Roseovarius sp. EL26]
MLGIFAKTFMTASRAEGLNLPDGPKTLNEHRFFVRANTGRSHHRS